MNNIYDLNEIEETHRQRKKLILSYVFYALCFIAVLSVCFVLLDNNLLLTIILGTLTFIFILFSICFFKIKYGILKEYSEFLENIETGRYDECVGLFEAKEEALTDGECFDNYIFVSHAGKINFLVYKQHKLPFNEGEKYHLTYVGKYLCEWEKID